jgi:hypothetical protein
LFRLRAARGARRIARRSVLIRSGDGGGASAVVARYCRGTCVVRSVDGRRGATARARRRRRRRRTLVVGSRARGRARGRRRRVCPVCVVLWKRIGGACASRRGRGGSGGR